jgi:hypothetical protein
MTTGTELVPENARGPAIPQDRGYLIQDLGDNLYFLTNGAYKPCLWLPTKELSQSMPPGYW